MMCVSCEYGLISHHSTKGDYIRASLPLMDKPAHCSFYTSVVKFCITGLLLSLSHGIFDFRLRLFLQYS
jgi:hypothetical protein